MARVDFEDWHIALASDGSTDIVVTANEQGGARGTGSRVGDYGLGERRAITTTRRTGSRELRVVEPSTAQVILFEAWTGDVVIVRSPRGAVVWALLVSATHRDEPSTHGLDVVRTARLSLATTSQTAGL